MIKGLFTMKLYRPLMLEWEVCILFLGMVVLIRVFASFIMLVCNFNTNMRLMSPELMPHCRAERYAFAQWVFDILDGRCQCFKDSEGR